MSNPYCFVCHACNHPAHLHGLLPGADVSGPYKCSDCGCEIRQDDPTYGWTQTQFEQYRRNAARLRRAVGSGSAAQPKER